MNKVEKLLFEIKKYNSAYRAGTPIISDKEYDKLVSELQRMDPENEWFKHIEPSSVAAGRKVKLPVPMKSLNKVKDIQAFKAWVKSIDLDETCSIVVMPKFDGLSLLHDEHTNKAYSRGGAENEGQDCSKHYQAASKISNADNKFNYTFGEFVFSCESWINNFAGKTSPETGDIYKSPRNTAAGLLNRDEASQNLKYVDFYRYGADEQSLANFNTYEEFYKQLCNVFHQPELYRKMNAEDLTAELCVELYKEWLKLYYIDGLVIYINDLGVWSRVGRHETTGNPNYAIAYKDQSFTDTFETIVKDITWNISKAGALKPVVNIETVDTGDCNMENPTGYNARWIYDHHIAKGAVVQVTRSGGVIPKILQTVKDATDDEEEKLWESLCYCPHCNAPTQWNDKQIELCCTNPECLGVRFAKIVFFFKTLCIENIGEETLAKIFNAGYTRLKDVLNITFEELLDIDGIGEYVANIFLDTTASIKSGIEVTRLMHASDCFNGIGQVKARTILSQLSEENRFAFYNNRFHTWESNDELQECDFFKSANITLRSFMLGIIPFYDFIAENELQMLPMAETPKHANGSMTGMKVCFTGIRDQQLERYVTDNGGDVVNSVSKKTTHLIVADKSSQSSKAVKAKQNGIPIMTVEEFKLKFNM